MTPHAQWDALMALHGKTTPGEWCAVNSFGKLEIAKHKYDRHPICGDIHNIAGHYGVGDDDAAFIVAAHNSLPALVAEYRRMREALEVIATCPPEAVHLMPLAAQAALRGAKGET